MDSLSFLQLGLSSVFTVPGLFFVLTGLMVGIVFGAIPGLTGTMAIILLIPFSYGMSVIHAMLLFSAIYCAVQFGGSISAILLNIPGAPEAICTTFDGYPLTRKGQAGKALGAAITASAIGGFLSVIVMIFLSPILAKVALKFSAAEFFSLVLMGLLVVSSLSGKSLSNSVIAMLVGILLGTVGVSSREGIPRFDFGIMELDAGFKFVSILFGLFVIGEVFVRLEKLSSQKQFTVGKYSTEWISLKELWRMKFTILRGSLAGIFAGILPGLGAILAVFLAYAIERRSSSHPEKFGTGVLEGVIAPEAANNASAGGAMIPTLTMGIPGSTITAVLLSVLIMHGIQPGPFVFFNSPDLVGSIFVGMLLTNILIIFGGWMVARWFTLILKLQYGYLSAAIILCSFLGCYALRSFMFDVWIMLIFGVVGYLMKKNEYPIGPLILGLVLGPIAEDNFQAAMGTFNEDVFIFLSRPVSAAFLAFGVISFLYPFIPKFFGKGLSTSILPQKASDTMQAKPLNMGEGIIFSCIAVISIYLYKIAGTYATEGQQFGADFWPKAILLGLILISVWKVIDFCLTGYKFRAKRILIEKGLNWQNKTVKEFAKPFFAVFGYLLAINYIGFFMANLLFLPLIMYVSNLKNKFGLIIFPIVSSLLTMVIFVKYLYISFPLGVGIFHEINVFVLLFFRH